MPTVLHVLSQRPGRTGSGVTLDALVQGAARRGWSQHVVVGVPSDDPTPAVAELETSRIHPLVFGHGALGFALPGMSDVMPYPSTPFGSLSAEQLEAYRAAWQAHVAQVVDLAQPDLIHSHHVWLVSAMLKEIAPHVPVVTHCHATGLRQMQLCKHLAGEVRRGCSRSDRLVALHRGHAEALSTALGVEPSRIEVVGAGFRDDLFHSRGRTPDASALLYAGKVSHAKGLPWLLDAVERLAPSGVTLHVAGSGSGEEADRLGQRMQAMAPAVQLHGQLSQAELAELARRCAVFVLPSFYEGLPLALVEAAACGCRLIGTRLPGVLEALAEPLAPALDLVDVPRMRRVDVPVDDDLPAFVSRLAAAIQRALAAPPIADPTPLVRSFTWDAVFARVEAIWHQVLG